MPYFVRALSNASGAGSITASQWNAGWADKTWAWAGVTEPGAHTPVLTKRVGNLSETHEQRAPRRSPLRHSRESHWHPGAGDMRLGASDARVREVIDVACAYGRSAAFSKARHEVLPVSGAAGNQHRNADRLAHGTAQLNLIAFQRAVPLDGRDQDLARAAPLALLRPSDRRQAGRLAGELSVDLVGVARTTRID